MQESQKQTPENDNSHSTVIHEAGSLALSQASGGQESTPSGLKRQKGHPILARVLATHELMYDNGNPAGFSPGGIRENISGLATSLKEARQGSDQPKLPETDRLAIEALSPKSAHAKVITRQSK